MYICLGRKYFGHIDEILRITVEAPLTLPRGNVEDPIYYCIVIKGDILILLNDLQDIQCLLPMTPETDYSLIYPLFYVCSHLSALQSCKSIFSTKF